MNSESGLRLFLCGDVMLGRAVDQLFAHPSDPVLYEDYLTDARQYLKLVENQSGSIHRPVEVNYPWGASLRILGQFRPHVRIINLETAVTTSRRWMPKGINYRMHPANVETLKTAGIDVCALANNHILDWKEQGLLETLSVVSAAGIQTVGAGHDLKQAEEPAVIEIGGKRVLVFAFAMASSGVPSEWAATNGRAGVNWLPDLTSRSKKKVQASLNHWQRPGDIIIVSIHWGGNWGYAIPSEQTEFAHWLLQETNACVLYGHSSHHVKRIEVYQSKLILYGCGDFINDYEGIHGFEEYRGDLSVMFLPTIDSFTGSLQSLKLVVLQIKRMQLQLASRSDLQWMRDLLNREGVCIEPQFQLLEQPFLHLAWSPR